MAYTCLWPCVSDVAPSVSAVVQSAATVQPVSAPTQSFAAALAGASVTDDRPFPFPCIKGDSLSIKICQDEYHKGVEEFNNALRVGMTIGPRSYGYSQKIPTMGRVKPCFMSLGTGPRNTHTY